MDEQAKGETAREQLAEANRQAAERLRASEEAFRLMVEGMPDYAMFMLSPEGEVVTWNAGAERISGYPAEEIIGRPFGLFYLEEDVASGKPRQVIEEVARMGRYEERGWRARKGGARFWAHLVVTALRDSMGRLLGFATVVRDMSGQHQAEKAGRDTAAQLQAVINTAVDGIIAINDRGLIEWLNPAALAIFGYSAEEVLGRNVSILMPEPYRSEHDTYMQNYLRTGQRKIIGIGREVQGRRKDGSVFPVDLAVSEVQLGDRRMFTGIVRDITQRKEAEQALVAAKEAAETASRAKDHFLAVVSHELRTPLTPILAAASMLQNRTDLPEDVKEDLTTIRRNVEHEARLVDDLLNLTRLNRGKIELHQEVVDAHAAIRAVVTQFQNEIDEKALELALSLRARRSRIWADPGRIQQVLSNLLGNAIKFTPEGGRIAVRTSNDGERLRIEFTDTGIGIEPGVLDRLFNPFEQGERTVTRKYGGLGLGLAISKGIVDLHGGTLAARSEGAGKGATFTLELASVPAVADGPAPSTVRRAGPGAGRRILVVEDHPDTLRIISRLLTQFGYNVTTATSVAEALALAAHEKFDLLISDIGLPDGSGLEIMRQLKRQLGIKGVAISGFGQAEDLRRSREAGFVEHLVKPVNFEALETLVNRLSS